MAELKRAKRKQRPFTEEELQHWLTLLTLMDDEFLEACFSDNNRGVELILRIILDKDDLVVQRVVVQKTLPNLRGRKVRLDIFAVDGEGKLYDIEIQVGGKLADLTHRARMYSALLDASQRVRGMDYRRLRETWVIFIVDRDIFSLGWPLYRIERQILGTEQLFGDGAHIVFVNGAYRDLSTRLGRLLHDLACPDPDKMYHEVLAQTVRFHKQTEEGVRKMSKVFEAFGKEERKRGIAIGEKRGKAEGIAIGEKRGKELGMEQTKLAFVSSMLANGCSHEEIARLTSLPLAEVQTLARLRDQGGHS